MRSYSDLATDLERTLNICYGRNQRSDPSRIKRIELRRGVPMIQYVCDTCSAVKGAGEVWLVGLAADAVGVTLARREVTIQSEWDRTTAVHPLAVHFCSIECKDEYMARLFAPEVPVKEVVVERAAPIEVVVEQVVPDKRRLITKTRKARHQKRTA